MNTPEELAGQVREAIFAGRKIQAIKLYREQTGVGLKEAKDAVEKLEDELRASSPGQFSKVKGKGCSTVILAAALIGVIVYSIAG